MRLSKKIFKENIYDFLKAIFGCLILGFLGAIPVANNSPGMAWFLTFTVILLFILLPVVLILFVITFVKAFQDKPKHSLIAFICCVLIPSSFVGSIASLKYFETIMK